MWTEQDGVETSVRCVESEWRYYAVNIETLHSKKWRKYTVKFRKDTASLKKLY